MSAIANIVVPDAATTPVNHTFAPQKVDGDTGRWQEKTTNPQPIGFWNLSAKLRDPIPGNDVYKQTVELSIPKLKTYTDINGNSITVVDYVHRFKGEFTLPSLGVLQDRKDLRKIVVGIYNDAQVIDQIENVNHTW